MRVEYAGQTSAPVTIPVTDAAPGIFTDQALGKGSPLIQYLDGSLNSAARPAQKGSIVTLYLTGDGIQNTLAFDGRRAAPPLQTPVLPVVVTVNGASATVLYAGATQGYAGLMAVVVQLDANIASGALPLSVQVGSKSSQTVNLYVQ